MDCKRVTVITAARQSPPEQKSVCRSPQAVTNANEYKIFSTKNGQSEAETIPNRPMHKRPLHKMLCNGLLL